MYLFLYYILAEAVPGVVQRCWKQCETVPTLQNSNRETHHKYDNDGEGNVAVEGKIRGMSHTDRLYLRWHLMFSWVQNKSRRWTKWRWRRTRSWHHWRRSWRAWSSWTRRSPRRDQNSWTKSKTRYARYYWQFTQNANFILLGIHACTIHTRDLDIYIFRKPRPPSEGCYCTGSHLIAAKIWILSEYLYD